MIGCFPLYPPLELLHSFGLTPITLWGMRPPVGGLPESDRHVQNFTCGVARCMLDFVLGGASGLLDALVMYNACDTLRNLPEIIERGLKEKGIIIPVFRMHVPAIASGGAGAGPYLDRRIGNLIQDLENHTGRSFSGPDFIASVGLYRTQRELSLRLEKLARDGKISFVSCSGILQRAHHMPVEDHIDLLEKKIAAPEEEQPIARPAIPVMISGIQVPGQSVLEAMEESGLRIVANDVATLRRSYGYSPEITDDPIGYYRDFYFNHYPCTTMLPEGDRRADLIGSVVRDYGIRGVVFLGEKFCEYEYFEMPYIEHVLQGAGIRSLRLEFGAEDSESPGAVNNRIMAFAEMLTMQMDS